MIHFCQNCISQAESFHVTTPALKEDTSATPYPTHQEQIPNMSRRISSFSTRSCLIVFLFSNMGIPNIEHWPGQVAKKKNFLIIWIQMKEGEKSVLNHSTVFWKPSTYYKTFPVHFKQLLSSSMLYLWKQMPSLTKHLFKQPWLRILGLSCLSGNYAYDTNAELIKARLPRVKDLCNLKERGKKRKLALAALLLLCKWHLWGFIVLRNNQRIFRAVKLLCAHCTGGYMSCTLVQAQRRRSTKSEPSCKLWTLGDDAVSMYVRQL